MEALDVNRTKAQIIDMVIRDIPDNKLKDFFVFRMQYIEPHKSADVATKEALADYQRLTIRAQLRKGGQLFKTPESVLKHLQTFYKGRDIVNGPAHFYDYVIIGMNKDGELINKYKINEHGNYSRLNGDDAAEVLLWLFNNQSSIGEVKFIPEREIAATLNAIDAPDYIPCENEISENVKGLLIKKK